MKELYRRALFGLAGLILILGIIIFLSAGSVRFWEGWSYLSIFAICVTIITIYFLKKDPALVERRINVGPIAEKEKNQKIIQSFGGLFFITLLIIPGLDYRFKWSNVPLLFVVIASILVLSGFIIIFWVFSENSFTTSTIEVSKAQPIVSTGPYQFVRHPMYFGGVLLLFFTPISMGSYWGLIFSIPLFIVIIIRLLDEEKLLLDKLPGYKNYCKKTKYHLIPLIW